MVLEPGLCLLESDELLHLVLGFLVQALEVLDQAGVARRDRLLDDALEELADAHLELGEDAEERVQADPVLALLHARQIGLLDTEARGELDLRQLVLLAQLADLASDHLDLTNLFSSGHDDVSRGPLCQDGIVTQSGQEYYARRGGAVKPGMGGCARSRRNGGGGGVGDKDGARQSRGVA